MRKQKDEDTTFEVRLLCRNCEHDWIEELDKGLHIRYEKDNNYMIQAGDSYKNRKYFTCPKCGANKKIARLPVKDFRT